jgi:hypothetical protein
MGTRESSKKIPSLLRAIVLRLFQLGTSPENSPFGTTAETLWVKKSTVVMVPEQCQSKIATTINAFSGIRTVTNYITKTVNLRNALSFNVGKNGGQGFEITMDVADDSAFTHEAS